MRRAERSTRSWSSAGSATATTSRHWRPSGAAGIVVDTAEVAGPWAVLPGPLRRGRRRPHAPSRGPWPPRPTSPTPTPTAHACTSLRRARTRGRRRAGASTTTAQAWDAVTDATLAHGPPSATTTASGSTARGSWPAPSARASTSWPASRRPSTLPASSTPASSASVALRRPALGMTGRQRPRRRRRDLGRARRHRAARRHREHVHHAPVLPDPPPPGSSSSTPPGWPTPSSRWPRPPWPRRAGGGGRHRQPAGHDHRLGPGHRRAAWPRASAGRTCARSAPAWSSRPRGSAWPPTCRPPSWRPSSTPSTPTASRAERELCFGTVDTWVAWTLGRRRRRRCAPRHRRHERRG